MDFLVEFDKITGHITVVNLKSRMSIEEARTLAGELVRVADEHSPKAA